jgi:hypothetical protein
MTRDRARLIITGVTVLLMELLCGMHSTIESLD